MTPAHVKMEQVAQQKEVMPIVSAPVVTLADSARGPNEDEI